MRGDRHGGDPGRLQIEGVRLKQHDLSGLMVEDPAGIETVAETHASPPELRRMARKV